MQRGIFDRIFLLSFLYGYSIHRKDSLVKISKPTRKQLLYLKETSKEFLNGKSNECLINADNTEEIQIKLLFTRNKIDISKILVLNGDNIKRVDAPNT